MRGPYGRDMDLGDLLGCERIEIADLDAELVR